MARSGLKKSLIDKCMETYIDIINSFDPNLVPEDRRKWLVAPLDDYNRNYFFFKELNLSGFKRVLEIGTGCGLLASFLKKHGHDVTCLDRPDDFYKVCRTKLGIEDMVQYQPVEPMKPLEVEGEFDVICGVSLWFLTQFTEDEVDFFYKDCQNRLRPDGKVEFFLSRRLF